jgi:multidrug efflux system outer membrane protein
MMRGLVLFSRRGRDLVGALLATALSGCMLGPDYQRPGLTLPEGYGVAGSGAVEAGAAFSLQPGQPWWTLYEDATLNALVTAAFRNNADLKVASARILESEAVLREADASLLPPLNAGALGSDSRVSRAGAVAISPGVPVVRRDYQLTTSTTFELDFWGRLRRSSEAARAQALGSRYARDTVSLTLAASVAQTWFAVRSADAQIALLRQSIATREETLGLTRRRERAGIAADIDVNQAAESLADARAQLHESERLRSVAAGQLSLLTGELALIVQPLASTGLGLPVPPLPAAGLPSTLLERRPDVAATEASLMAANALIGVAQASRFPTFSLTGLLGGDSLSMSNLLSAPARIWSVGGNVTLPVIDWGRYQARTEQAVARQQQAAATWEKAVQVAFRDVADALGNLAQARASEADYAERASRSRERLRLARLRYGAGYSGFLEVLDGERSANEAALAEIRNRQAVLAYSVDLMRALGGGWSKDMPGEPGVNLGEASTRRVVSPFTP